jgi:hypothetical protein
MLLSSVVMVTACRLPSVVFAVGQIDHCRVAIAEIASALLATACGMRHHLALGLRLSRPLPWVRSTHVPEDQGRTVTEADTHREVSSVFLLLVT